MARELWSFDELVRAAGATADGSASLPITGISIDTRTLASGDVFVALRDQRDGHDFVEKAFAAGAAAALVEHGYARKPSDGALIRAADPLGALGRIGRAARARLEAAARVIAVTGSAGKTTTKELLRLALEAVAPARVHSSERSYNNHWGVPLTLARMPRDTRFAVFEIGMNHASEISPLSRMVAPHAAVVTTIEAVHLAHFASVEGIAEAKAEIFDGLPEGGTAVIPADNAHSGLLERRAHERGAHVVSFGEGEGANVRLVALELATDTSRVRVIVDERLDVEYSLGLAGRHNVMNSLAVIGAIAAAGLDDGEMHAAIGALAEARPPAGRGTQEWLAERDKPWRRVLLIDESYNANPASMRAALENLKLVRHWTGAPLTGRRIAVLGDMLELGPDAPQLHAGLDEAIDAAGVDLVFASGSNMAHLFERLPEARRGTWGSEAKEIAAALLDAVRPGDAVMIKGSNGSRMSILVEALRKHFNGVPAA